MALRTMLSAYRPLPFAAQTLPFTVMWHAK